MLSKAKQKAQQRASYQNTNTCAKRAKGIPEEKRARMSNVAISRQPTRCQSSGGPSGKSNNAGKPPKWERNGIFTSPPKGRPSKQYL